MERSHDLVDWTPDETFGFGGEIYGMSHDCVVPMRQFTPPTASPPGGGTPPAGQPPLNVSIRFQRCISGGTVATWPALSGSGGVSVLIPGELDDGWDDLRLFWKQYGDYRIFVWHPLGVLPAPAAGSLSLEDAAFRDALVEHFADINNEVDLNQVEVRNAPPPAPPSPDSKVFWRIRANWSIDTDGDGTPDWAEFELIEDEDHPSHLLGDPFNKDRDSNGQVDGLQIDFDGDGTPDLADGMPNNFLASSSIISTPRYAVFPITNATPPVHNPLPIQLSDRGTVLYVNGTWAGGKWVEIQQDGQKVSLCRPLAVNDLDEIAGSGFYQYQEDPDAHRAAVLVHWSSPSGIPIQVEANEEFAVATEAMSSGAAAPGTMFSADGKVVAKYGTIEERAEGKVFVQHPEEHVWTMPSHGRTIAKGPEVRGMWSILNNNTYWGLDHETNVPSVVTPLGSSAIAEIPTNVVWSGNAYHAFYKEGKSYPDTLSNSSWRPNFGFEKAIDMSSDGTVIAANGRIAAPILINGLFYPMQKLAPQVNASWVDGTVKLVDVTPGGLILAQRGAPEAPSHAILLPLKIDGNLDESPKPL